MSERSFGVRLFANVTAYVSAMKEAERATSGFSSTTQSQLDRAGQKMSDVGGKMSTRLTLPLVALGAGALKLGSDFNTTFGQMVGLAGVPAAEIDGLRDSVLDLAGETAQAPQDLAESLYFAASAGLDSAEAMDAVTIAAKAAQVGMGSTQDVVGLVASAMATYGADTIDAARATDILTATIREGRAEPSELAGTLGRVLPVAKQIGVSFEEVGGTVAYLSNVFGDTNRTVTATQGLFTKLASPTKQGRDALADFGLSAGDLQRAIDKDGLLGALELLKTAGIDKNAQAMAALFDDMEGRSAALALLGADSETLAGIFEATASSTGALDEALGAVDGNANAMKQAWVDIQVALIQVGEIIGPIAAGIAGGISEIVSAFGDLPAPVQATIVGVAGFVAAIGPMLKFGGMIVSNLAAIRTGLMLLSTAMMGHPIIAFATIAATVGTALYVMSQRGDAAKQAIRDLAVEMNNAAGGPAEALIAKLTGMVEGSNVLLGSFDAAGVTVQAVAEAAMQGGASWDDMAGKIVRGSRDIDTTASQREKLRKFIEDFPGMAQAAAAQAEVLGRVTGEGADATDAATAALEGNAEAVDESAGAWEGLGDKIEEARKEHEKMIESIIKGAEGLLSYEAATLNVANGVRELHDKTIEANEALADGSLTADEHATILTNLRLEQIGLANDVLTAAQAYAASQGAVDGSTESAQAQIAELERQRALYPELATDIDGFIAHLLMVPGTVSTVVTADTKQAEEAIRILRSNIDALVDFSNNNFIGPGKVKVTPSGKTTLGGGGASGITTAPGRLHEFGESNRPEAFFSGGRSYLLSGNAGKIMPMGKLTAAQQGWPGQGAGQPAPSGPLVQTGDIYTQSPQGVRQELEEMAWMAGAR